ncbi:MAG: Type II/IV secretion system protein [Pelotomaculum sp. PtaU1.Bin065]|nr:MAG: Type II/IV secretion system protein [Pelotomaculum sp. PtaU1.Bin065]
MFKDRIIGSLINTAKKEYEKPKVGKTTLEGARDRIRNLLSETSVHSDEERAQIKMIEKEAMLGDKESEEFLKDHVRKLLDDFGIEVPGMTSAEVAADIFKHTWGLGPAEELYNKTDVDEVDINGVGNVYIFRRGKPEKVDISFSKKELESLVTRLLVNSPNLTTSRPHVRTVRKDKTRVHVTGPDITSGITVCLRKKDTFIYSKENLIESGTMDEKTYELLTIIFKWLLNVLISGSANSGKTSMLVYFFGFNDPEIRTLVIEPELEILLSEAYPGWNIIDMQQQPNLGIDTDVLYERVVLQMTPQRVIEGEILDGSDVKVAIKAGLRNVGGNLATFHTEEMEEVFDNMAMSYMEKSGTNNITKELAMQRVVRAFDIVVHMATSKKGQKKVVRVAHPYIFDSQLKYHDIVVWKPGQQDYFEGEWEHHPLPARIVEKMFKNGFAKSELAKKGFGWQ